MINAFNIQYVTEKENNAHQALLGEHCCASGSPELPGGRKGVGPKPRLCLLMFCHFSVITIVELIQPSPEFKF